jgi:diguanylate cyclase (GGDEF)-like protein/putative nucleotidyltransferase with HDIG domain
LTVYIFGVIIALDMSIYTLLPLIVVMAYIPLLVMTIGSRPWQKQHKLFIFFLVPATIFGFIDFFLRGNFFLQYNPLLLKLGLITYTLVGVQFYCFVSSFFAPGERRWLSVAYATLAATIALVLIGYIPGELTLSGDRFYLDYGIEITLATVPLLALVGRGLYLFWKRLKVLDNPVLYNQIVSLVLSVSVWVIFTLAILIPWGKEFPLSHFGNVIVALILGYGTIRRQLVDIRFVLRRALSWLILVASGIVIYALLFLSLNLWLGLELHLLTLTVGLGVAALVSSLIYSVRGIPQQKIDQAFYRKTYDNRHKLLDFVGRIHNVFSLRELSGELLGLIVGAIKCRRACLLFPEGEGGDFIPRFVEPQEENNPLSGLKLRHDNPIVRYLSRKHRLLTIQSLDSMPEFNALSEEGRKGIKTAEIELFMPVISRGNLVSILILSRKQSGRYLLEDISLLEDITSRVAVSLERGYLHEEVRQRQEELSVISHLGAILTSSLDIREIYDSFVKELGKVVDVDLAAIALVEGEELNLLALSSEGGAAWQTGDKLPLKGTATEWVVTHKAPLIEPNLTEESRFWTAKHHLKKGIQSMIFLPLIVNDKAIGSLSLGSRQPNAYSQSQVQLLSQLASRIATPIENARLYAEAEQRARIDQLTSLWNRRHLEERIQVEIGRHSRYGGTFSLIILDLDFFKAFNDSYGHLAGDKLLKQLGAVMREAIRGTDEAFRYGGDEFAVLLPHTTLRDAYEVAERVRDRITSEIKVEDISVTASFGLASWPVDGVRINEVIAAADIALYYAKQSGGNQSHAISELLIPSPKPPTKLEVEQDRSAFNLICALAAAVDAKDHYAYKHSQKVREYAVALAKSLELAPADIARLSTVALLHDIGKIGISDEILNKAAKLTNEEWEIIRSHPQLGADIVSNVPELASYLAGILYHHEHYDGSGYPAGLKGEAIPLDARILCIVDSFAAMTSARPYRAALSVEEAVEELKRGAGKQFDPNLVKVFIPTAQTMALVAAQEPG